MLPSEDWAPLYRRIFKSDEWLGQKVSTKVVLVWIIGRVRHIDSMQTPAGSLDFVLQDICDECELTPNTVRTALEALTASGFIELSRVRNGSRLRIRGASRWLRNVKPAADANESPMLRSKAQKLTDESSDFASPSSKEEKKDLSATQRALPLQQAQDLRIGKKKVDGYKETIDVFHQLFVERYGAKPSWRVVEGAQLKRLLAAHGAEEVQRRIHQLFTSPPRWLHPPYTFGTLVRHFDHLVVPGTQPTTKGARQGGLSPSQIMQRAAGMVNE